ncbi:MAG: DUF4982 domain-containing protein [Sedimentisphaerales bacterium]|nr:DUF4982 domain-containing protein [Sedimentisphaerales bacterium]
MNKLLLLTLGALLTASQAVFHPSLATEPGQSYQPPESPRRTFCLDPDWRFVRQDVPEAVAPDFNDADWQQVSLPHTYNDEDSFDGLISRSGEVQLYMGPATYRKRFALPEAFKGRRVFLEFEGMRQAGKIYVNGRHLGTYENGVTPYGLDITDAGYFGQHQNVITIRITNAQDYREEATGVPFQWQSRDFNPNFGGLNRHARLHITGLLYQTLPLYESLRTTGVYIYADGFSISDRTATIHVESQVRNQTGTQQVVTLYVAIVQPDGKKVAEFAGQTYDMVDGETCILTAQARVTGLRFWDPQDPYLYDVYTIIRTEDGTADVLKTTTGFRKAEFKGGVGKGGVYINDRFVYLRGYAQRSSNEWAAIGGAYPDWLHDYNARLVRESNANYIRWMHIAPNPQDVRACDRYGIIQVCPAGDKERDVTGRQWEQRLEVMRTTIIYYRNNPSILFWEAGNSGISAAHMQQMVELRRQFDPNGGRAMGCRTLTDPATTSIAEYFGVMIAEDPARDSRRTYTDIFRGYSDQRRDLAPIIETEDFRDEAARRFWDDFSPPHFGFKKGPNDTYNWNSETFCLAAAARYWAYYSKNISNTDPNMSKWSGYASIVFADSCQHGRQPDSEVCRVSGKVDAVRIPKQIYYLHRVMQNDRPDIHIIGHWTYPPNTRKTVYIVANHCDAVELLVNGRSIGLAKTPKDGYVYAFGDVTFEPGIIKAIGYNGNKVICSHQIQTAGPAKAIRLTCQTSPGGLIADGADVAFFDVEVVDEDGIRCPTDEDRIDFELTGPAIWRGGYNSGRIGSVNKTYLYTECGINRVFIRSTLQPGTITLEARRTGLIPASITIESRPVTIQDGLIAP